MGELQKKFFFRWMLVSKFAKKNIFNTFDLCLSSSQKSKEYLQELNAKNIKFIGNIKLSSKLNIENFKNTNESFFNKRKVWSAASTHKGKNFFV